MSEYSEFDSACEACTEAGCRCPDCDRRSGENQRQGGEGNFIINGEKVYSSSKNSMIGTKYKDCRAATVDRRQS